MARSPLTLAAAVTAALPGAEVIGVRPLTAAGSGRYDAIVASLVDGREVVVRAPVDETAARELAAETIALRALTPGVRELLGLRTPEPLGEAVVDDDRVLITDLVDGYQVDAAHLPRGRGAATSVGQAVAAIHALPFSVVRSAGLSERTPDESRAEVAQVIDRSAATGKVPARLIVRWQDAADDDALWRFESTVVLGGAQTTSFLFVDDEQDAPVVAGLVEWHGLSIDDPAIDLRWLASAPEAADDVHAAYVAAAHRAPDSALRVRARLHAELEFARWLVHGHEARRDDIVADAAGLLEALADGVRDDDLRAELAATTGPPQHGVDDALALLDSVNGSSRSPIDTSMQTDAYDPEQLSLFARTAWDEGSRGDASETDTAGADGVTEDASETAQDETAPVGDTARTPAGAERDDSEDDTAQPTADEVEALRAARAAFQRWSASAE